MRVLAVTNMFPSAAAPDEGTFVEQQVTSLRSLGLEVDVLHLNRRGQGMRTYLATASAVRVRLLAKAPDLVHVMYGGVMALQVTRAVRETPAIVSYCGSDLLGQPSAPPLRRWLAGLGVSASRAAAIAAAAVVVKSANLYRALPARSRVKAAIIPNGIDLQRFRPVDRTHALESLGWPTDEFHVLFAAKSADETKRVDLARSSVERLADLGIRARLHEMAGIPHCEVPVWLNASDVLLLTSAHEGSPNIVKEALACDRPVVSVDVGDVRERLSGVENGEICEASPARIAEAMQRVAGNPGRRGGRASVAELSLERTAAALRALYERCREHGALARA